MCIAFSGPPEMKVDFTGSTLAAFVSREQSTYGQHVIAYQNEIEILGLIPKRRTNNPSNQWQTLINPSSGRTGAAMLIVIPLKENGDFELLSADGMPNFLSEMNTPPMVIASSMLTRGGDAFSKSIDFGGVVVRPYGIYTAVVFKNASIDEIKRTISTKVDQNRQPEIDEESINFMMSVYNPKELRVSNFAIVLFCYDPYEVLESGKKSLPITIRYETSDPSILFAPGLDQHDPNKRPDMKELVPVDHRIAWGHNLTPSGISVPVHYSSKVGKLGDIVPDRVVQTVHNGILPNGDFVMKLSNLIQGKVLVERWQPPAYALGLK